MSVILKTKIHTARKDYYCDACMQLLDYGLDEIKFTDEEVEAIEKAKLNDWKIKAGEKYLYQVSVLDGDFYTVKVIPDIDRICKKYEVYDTE